MVNLTQLLSVGIDAVVTVLEKWGVTGLNINFDFQASENLISRLLMWIYGWMGNYGWTIILFTVVLRVITLPLDFWQKFSMKKNSKIKNFRVFCDKIFFNDRRKKRGLSA